MTTHDTLHDCHPWSKDNCMLGALIKKKKCLNCYFNRKK